MRQFSVLARAMVRCKRLKSSSSQVVCVRGRDARCEPCAKWQQINISSLPGGTACIIFRPICQQQQQQRPLQYFSLHEVLPWSMSRGRLFCVFLESIIRHVRTTNRRRKQRDRGNKHATEREGERLSAGPWKYSPFFGKNGHLVGWMMLLLTFLEAGQDCPKS